MDRLDSYRIFYEVAKVGNLTKAGEKLYISQPAISQVIKKMEDQLKAKLFIRNKNGVILTRFGSEVFKNVERAMLSFNAIDCLAESENELKSGKLVIGSGSTIAREVLVAPIEKFLKDFPNIQMSQIEDVQSVMFDKLRQGEVDLIITHQIDQADDLEFQIIENQRYIFIKKKNCEFKRLIKLTKGSYTFALFDSFQRQMNLQTLPEIVVSGYRMAIELVRRGVGLALVPESLARESLKSGEIEVVFEDFNLPQINLGYYTNKFLKNRATEVFIKYLE